VSLHGNRCGKTCFRQQKEKSCVAGCLICIYPVITTLSFTVSNISNDSSSPSYCCYGVFGKTMLKQIEEKNAFLLKIVCNEIKNIKKMCV